MNTYSTPPDPVLGLRIASQLLLADEGKYIVTSQRALSNSLLMTHSSNRKNCSCANIIRRTQRPGHDYRNELVPSTTLPSSSLRILCTLRSPRRDIRFPVGRLPRENHPRVLCADSAARGIPCTMVRSMVRNRAGLPADSTECAAGGSSWRDEERVESLWAYVPLQLGTYLGPFLNSSLPYVDIA